MQKIGIAASAVGVPVGLLATTSVNVFADLESQISRNTALIGGGKAEYEELLALSKELGASTPFDAQEIAAGVESLAAAGYSLAEIKASMETVTQMAMATGEPLSNMSDILVGALSSFEQGADQAEVFGDKLATIANVSTASMQDVGESLKYAGSTAHAFGKDLDEVGAALAVLANRNIKGSQAGTGLNEIFARLAKTPKDAKKVLEEYGIALDEVNPSANSLLDILTRLKSADISATDMVRLFGLEAAPKAMALMSDSAIKGMMVDVVRAFITTQGKIGFSSDKDKKTSLEYPYEFLGKIDTSQSTSDGQLERIVQLRGVSLTDLNMNGMSDMNLAILKDAAVTA